MISARSVVRCLRKGRTAARLTAVHGAASPNYCPYNIYAIRSLSGPPTAVSRKGRKAQRAAEATVEPYVELSFAQLADICMHDIYTAVKEMAPLNDPFDITIEARELSIGIGQDGSFVFSFKHKNELLQMNSPVSGLMEYKYDRNERLWRNVKDGHDFRGIVTRDMLRLCAGCPNFK